MGSTECFGARCPGLMPRGCLGRIRSPNASRIRGCSLQDAKGLEGLRGDRVQRATSPRRHDGRRGSFADMADGHRSNHGRSLSVDGVLRLDPPPICAVWLEERFAKTYHPLCMTRVLRASMRIVHIGTTAHPSLRRRVAQQIAGGAFKKVGDFATIGDRRSADRRIVCSAYCLSFRG